MASKRCYYEVLGVERTVSKDEISVAYRRLAIKFHPDKNPGDEEAVARFKEAAEAFEVLGDADKRARYDRYGHAGVDGAAGRGPHFTDINDIFEAFGDIFSGGGGGFGDIFGGGRRGNRQRRGADVRSQVTIDLIEAARGVAKVIEFDRHVACSDCQATGAKPGTQRETCRYCGGRGQVVQASGIFRVQTNCPSCHGQGSYVKEPCPGCSGEGYVLERVKREVRIPAGVDSDTRLRIEGEGEPSPNGGPRGDCYVFITVKEHPLFHRDGQHLICQVPLTYPQAALGTTIEVPTLDGREELEIPAGTQPGAVFKLRGRGMRDPRRRGVGDLLVQVVLEVPKKLEPREEELLRELAEVEHTNVSPHRKSFFERVKEYFSLHDETEKSED
ncbi:MAG: molecular chaperone DnaJ [Pirellulales bacterium]|nr:molecular chaperone DnaJ [Pirellulales bacterium]